MHKSIPSLANHDIPKKVAPNCGMWVIRYNAEIIGLDVANYSKSYDLLCQCAAFPLLIHKTFKDCRKSYDSVILHLVRMRNSEALPNADPAMLVLAWFRCMISEAAG
jgi:hypothetical protein